jgi:hypothetical protein
MRQNCSSQQDVEIEWNADTADLTQIRADKIKKSANISEYQRHLRSIFRANFSRSS